MAKTASPGLLWACSVIAVICAWGEAHSPSGVWLVGAAWALVISSACYFGMGGSPETGASSPPRASNEFVTHDPSGLVEVDLNAYQRSPQWRAQLASLKDLHARDPDSGQESIES